MSQRVFVYNGKTGEYLLPVCKVPGRFTTTDRSQAGQFDTTGAKNVLAHLPKKIRGPGWKTIPVPSQQNQPAKKMSVNPASHPDPIPEAAENPQNLEPVPDPPVSIDFLDEGNLWWSDDDAQEWVEEITKLIDELSRLSAVFDYAGEYFSQRYLYFQKAQQDLLHKAEFDNLNAAEGYKLYKLIHESRRMRRFVKDSAVLVGIFKQYGRTFDELNCVNEEVKAYSKALQARKYAPRAMPELFRK